MPSPTDLRHLNRCVQLAEEALLAGDQPFGSLLVDGHGVVRLEARNHAVSGDATRHPELELAQWAARNLTAAERAGCTVYTSGEHCPMCAAAHGWAGLGRIVYAVSSAELSVWLREWGRPGLPVRPLAVAEVAPEVPVVGPVPELAPIVKELHRRSGTGGT